MMLNILLSLTNFIIEKVNHIIESLAQKGVQIIQKNVKIKKNSRQYLLQVNFTLIEKIDNKL